MDAAPVLDYLAKDDIPSLGALGPVHKLRVFAKSVGRVFVRWGISSDARSLP